MQMEWVFMGAVAVTAVILVLVIRRTVRMCAKTIFAQAEEPTPEEVKASQTPQALPEQMLWQLVCENYREQPLQFQQIVQIK